MSVAARSDGPIPWRSAPGRSSFSRLQPLLPLKGGVAPRPMLPVEVFRYQASYVERVGGERTALGGTYRRCSRCEARSRRPERSRVVKYTFP